jgi:hypothetical protein
MMSGLTHENFTIFESESNPIGVFNVAGAMVANVRQDQN